MAFTRKAQKRKKRRKTKRKPVARTVRTPKKRKTKRRKGKSRGKKLSSATIAAAMRAYSGEDRETAAEKKRAEKMLAKTLKAFSGESRHSPEAENRRLQAAIKRAFTKRERALSNPRRRRRGRNPIHIPKDPRGRPARVAFWLLDVYKGNKVTTYIGNRRVDKRTAERDAMAKLLRLKATRVALSGPYRVKPHVDSKRK